MKDRTGELCSFCKKGKLKPTSNRGLMESVPAPNNGKVSEEISEYECENCGKKYPEYRATLRKSITSSANIVKPLSDKKSDK